MRDQWPIKSFMRDHYLDHRDRAKSHLTTRRRVEQQFSISEGDDEGMNDRVEGGGLHLHSINHIILEPSS